MSLAARRPIADLGPPSAFTGVLEEFSIFDVGQFLMLNRKTGTLTVRSDPHAVYLTFKDGQLLNAVDERLKNGEAVILAAVQWRSGSFDFEAGPVSPERLIQDSTESVLLEAARVLDEMRAGDQLDDGDVPTSQVEKFQEAQERAEALSEVFRRAVTTESDSSLGASWKETLMKSLSRGEIERLFIGPGERIRVVSQDRVQIVDVPSPEDVLAWADSLLPAPENWSEVSGGMLHRRPHGPDEALWVTRSGSPEGDWFVITQPWANFPNWNELGLDEDLANRIEAVEGKAVLLVTPNPQLSRLAIAAWLSRRAELLPSSGWILESSPSYDWRRLAGRLEAVPPRRFERPGDLVSLRDLTGAKLLVVNGVRDGWLLAEAMGLAAEGTRVIVSVPGPNVAQAVQRLDEWLSAPRLGSGSGRAASKLGAAWHVQHSNQADGPALQARFVLQKDPGK